MTPLRAQGPVQRPSSRASQHFSCDVVCLCRWCADDSTTTHLMIPYLLCQLLKFALESMLEMLGLRGPRYSAEGGTEKEMHLDHSMSRFTWAMLMDLQFLSSRVNFSKHNFRTWQTCEPGPNSPFCRLEFEHGRCLHAGKVSTNLVCLKRNVLDMQLRHNCIFFFRDCTIAFLRFK